MKKIDKGFETLFVQKVKEFTLAEAKQYETPTSVGFWEKMPIKGRLQVVYKDVHCVVKEPVQELGTMVHWYIAGVLKCEIIHKDD